MRFSERMGYKPVKEVIQRESMDSDLRNSLWNTFLNNYGIKRGYDNYLMESIWVNYLKIPRDEFTPFGGFDSIKQYFFNCEWYEVYDLMEFVVKDYHDPSINQEYMDDCNNVLETELSAYRFVNTEITEITSEEEINEIEEALNQSPNPVKKHLKDALELLSDKKNPNYRNSIKESISAVESLCKLITGNDNTTLGKALDKIEKDGQLNMHGALKGAFDKLYGYTSSSGGIRHAFGLLDEPNLDLEDAKFMLVSCSAFINYLITKAAKAQIEL